MTISLKADAGGTSGTIQVNGVDKVFVDSTGLDSGLSIGASVAANALTITLNPCTLRFRSSTLGSGTVNNRAVASALSLTIPSGATLGTVSGQKSRLVVYAFDNAGTVVLGVGNEAVGGDETGLMNPLILNASSTSAGTAYATSALSSVPYRVVGYVESTQATAGTWATAPSTIQGAGGNAITSMQSLGYGQTWQDVTGSRSKSTTYYNTTGKPICLNVVVATTATGQSHVITVNGVAAINFTSMNSFNQQAFCIVPVGASYSVSGTSSTVQSWTELR